MSKLSLKRRAKCGRGERRRFSSFAGSWGDGALPCPNLSRASSIADIQQLITTAAHASLKPRNLPRETRSSVRRAAKQQSLSRKVLRHGLHTPISGLATLSTMDESLDTPRNRRGVEPHIPNSAL